MNEFELKAFSTEADILNKGINRNIPNIFGNTSLDPNTSHSIWNISNWTGGGGDDGGDGGAGAEAAYQAKIRADKKKATQDVWDLYDAYGLGEDATDAELEEFAYGDPVRRSYNRFAMDAPITGIEDQRSKALGDLTVALSRQGLGGGKFSRGGSSSEVNRKALAKKMYAKGQVEVASRGDREAMKIKDALLAARGASLGQIDAATDPASAVSMSMSNAEQATQPGKFDPVLKVFEDITKGMLIKQEVEQKEQQRAMYNRLIAGLPTDSSSIKGG